MRITRRTLCAALTVLALTFALLAFAGSAEAAGRRTRITMHWNTTRLYYGQVLVVSGRVTPKAAGGRRRTVVAQYWNGRVWVRAAAGRANRRGAYRLAFRVHTLGRYAYRVLAPRMRGVRAAHTRWVYIGSVGYQTRMTVDAHSTRIYYGAAIGISGRVSPAAVPGTTTPRLVQLYKADASGNPRLLSQTRAAGSSYAFRLPGVAPGTGHYIVRVPQVVGASEAWGNWLTINVYRDPSQVSITSSASRVRLGAKVTVSGRVTGGYQGGVRQVVLYRKLRSGSLAASGVTSTDGYGRYHFTVPTGFFVSHDVYVQVRATSTSAAADSTSKALVVLPNYPPLGRASSWTNLAKGYRSRWNPCGPALTWRINTTGAKAGALADAKAAFVRLHQATGLNFRYLGKTTAIPGNGRRPIPRGTNIVVSWARPAQTTWPLTKDVAARGGPITSRWGRDGYGRVAQALTGGVVVDATKQGKYATGFKNGDTRGALLLHELGHVMGLGHTSGGGQLMQPTLNPKNPARYGAGDLAGLARVGIESGCITPLSGRPMLGRPIATPVG